MKEKEIIGIIVEYNPFHNGHIYHINKIKEKYPNSLIIAIINGYFTQRGNISIMTKEDKVKLALSNGVDIALELPFVFGTQSSDIFAFQSIKILNEFKINRLIFGSESNNIELLKKVADIELSDSEYNKRIKEYLNQGFNYPTALSKALNIEEKINEPNDLLAISYLKSIIQINPNIIPETIKRTNNYHDLNSNENIISASNIRNRLENGENITKYVPKMSLNKLQTISFDILFKLLKYKILTDKDLSTYLDVDEGIESRLLNVINQTESLEDLIKKIKTKRYTYNKINRMLIHILIGFTKDDNQSIKLDYLKILGFTKPGKLYLNTIKKELTLPVNPPKNSLIFKYELISAYLYEEIVNNYLNNFDINNKPVIKND